MNSTLEIIPAGHGRAVRLSAGSTIKIVNSSGTQVVDTWAFEVDDIRHFMSMEHSRVENGRLFPLVGGEFFSNRRVPILRLIEDSSPGIHDTIMAACDAQRYERLGAASDHRSCVANLREAMAELGAAVDFVPPPLNLFMNIPIEDDGALTQGQPMGSPGDFVMLHAELDCIVALSACPQDMTPINGLVPTDAKFLVR
jgi:uncharacterized protein YcgI (DUF1989 family)